MMLYTAVLILAIASNASAMIIDKPCTTTTAGYQAPVITQAPYAVPPSYDYVQWVAPTWPAWVAPTWPAWTGPTYQPPTYQPPAYGGQANTYGEDNDVLPTLKPTPTPTQGPQPPVYGGSEYSGAQQKYAFSILALLSAVFLLV